MIEKYYGIIKHYEDCYFNYGDNCKGVDWPNEIDAQKRYSVMMSISEFDVFANKQNPIRVLDFGCGLGHLYKYILDNELKVEYCGVDISETFVEKCRKKYEDVCFIHTDILQDDIRNLQGKFDYAIMNGVFTEKCNMTYDEMYNYFKSVTKRVFEICNRGIAFNVMSKDVDWERDDLFHLPLNELSSFLTKELSRCFIVRNDYGLYEYTTYVYKVI